MTLIEMSQPERFDFRREDGTTVSLTAEEVGALCVPLPREERNPDGSCPCRLCGRVMFSASALGPHHLSHLRVVGLAAPRRPNKAKTKTKAKAPRGPVPAKRREEPRQVIPVEDAVAGMLLGMTGRDTLPIDRLPEVIRWADATGRLIESLR